MLSKFRISTRNFLYFAKNKTRRNFSTKIGNDEGLSAQNAAKDVTRSEKLQFSKHRLVDFGQLPLGEIPDALQYDRPFRNFIKFHH